MNSEILESLLAGRSLRADQATDCMHQILEGHADPAWLGAFLVALRLKGETAEEIAGFAGSMRDHATSIPCSRRPVVDTCGTGGDGAHTFNISTATAFVVAAAGQAVAKHGNRAVSSRAGSADLLEALGAKLDLSPEAVGRCVDEVGIGFLFAPALHGAMRHAAATRKALGIRTVFNLLGPLTNPAQAEFQVLGVYSRELLDPMAEVLRRLGSRGALVVHGHDGLDELSVCAPTDARLSRDGRIEEIVVEPARYGLGPHPTESLRGGSAEENATLVRQLFSGRRGAAADVVVLNAGAALWVAQASADLGEGIDRARAAIESGAAAKTLEAFVRFTRAESGARP